MRFFKSFTLLHRKTKSDGNVHVKVTPKGHTQTRSLSFVSAQHFDEQVIVANNAIFDAVVPSSNNTHSVPIPHPAATSAHSQTSMPAQSSTSTQVPVLYQRVRTLESENAMLKSNDRIHSSAVENALNHRIRLLESELSQANSAIQTLSDSTDKLHTTIEELEEDIRNTRDQLYDTLHKDARLLRQAKADDEEIQRLQDQLTQCTKFLELLIDIGLHEPVLARVQVALRVGDDADEALVESIMEAASKPGSPWARIIPAVTGPRTSDNYISAINTTLKVRRELMESKKFAKFWKNAAKENHEHADTITPSSSNISSIHEKLSEERQHAVDELLDKLKNGPRPRGARPTFASPEPQSAVTDDDFGTPTEQDIPLTSTSTSFSSIRDYADPVRDCNSPTIESDASARNSTSTIRSRYVPNLAPLASQSFKEELVATESFKHLSKRTSSSTVKGHTRTVLGEVDLNRNRNTESKILPSESTTTQGSKRSAKALGKRRALVVTESIDSIEAVYGPSSARSLALSNISAAGEDTLSVLCNEESKQLDDSGRMSIGSTAFDNPALNSSMNHASDIITCNYTYNLPARTLVKIDEDSETNASNSTISSVARLSNHDEYDTSATTNVNIGDDSEVCSTLLPDDFSFVAESIISTTASPTKNTVVTPNRVSPAKSPVTLSRLPVLKHLRRLSVSVGLSQGGLTTNAGANLRTTTPLIVKKKLSDLAVRSTPANKLTAQSPARPTPPIPTLSHLSTPTKQSSPGRRIVNSGRRAARTLSRIVS